MNEANTGIYTIESPSNRIYVGQSWNLKQRINSYKSSGSKNQPKLYHSIKKYGWEAHKFIIIMPLKNDTSQAIMDWYEQFFIDYYRNEGIDLMNLKEGGANGLMSAESKEKMRTFSPGYDKLTVDKVKEIMVQLNLGIPATQIAKQFNVRPQHIYRIKSGERCGWLTGMSKEKAKLLPKTPKVVSEETKSRARKAHNDRASEKEKETIKLIVQRIQSGERCEDIAKDYGVSRQLISGIKSGRNWSSVTGIQVGASSRQKLNHEMVQLIFQRIQSGEKFKTIAADFNVCPGYISNINVGKYYSSITGIIPKQK